MANELQTKLDTILEDKNTNLLPEHLKAGVTCLGVEGEFEGRIKLFETKEEMDADTDSEEGTLAIVYRDEVQNWDGISAITSLTFPKTVTLPSTMTGDCYGYSMGDVYLDINGSVGEASASFRIYGDASYIIRYTSTDGLTYTRTDSYDETIIVSEEAVEIEMHDFSEVCGYFMKTGGMKFEGLYEYGDYEKNSVLATNIDFELTNVEVSYDVVLEARRKLMEELNLDYINGIDVFVSDDGKKLRMLFDVYTASDGKVWASEYLSCIYDGSFYAILNNDAYQRYCYEYDIDAASWQELTLPEPITLGSFTNKVFKILEGYHICASCVNGDTQSFNSSRLVYVFTNTSSYTQGTVYYTHLHGLRYNIAPTQLTLSDVNQLLPGKTAYGKNGVVTGDGTIYNNLDINDINNCLFWGNLTSLKQTKIITNDTSIFDDKTFRLYGFSLADNVNSKYITDSKIKRIVADAGGTSIAYCIVLSTGIYLIFSTSTGSHCLSLSLSLDVIADNVMPQGYTTSYSDIYDRYDNCLYHLANKVITKYDITNNTVTTLATLTGSYGYYYLLSADEDNLYAIAYNSSSGEQCVFNVAKATGTVSQLRTYTVPSSDTVRISRGLWYSHAGSTSTTARNVVTNATKNVVNTLMYSNITDKYYSFSVNNSKNYLTIYDNELNTLQTIELSKAPKISYSEYITSVNDNYICTNNNVIRISDGQIIDQYGSASENQFYFNVKDAIVNWMPLNSGNVNGETYYYGLVTHVNEPIENQCLFLLSELNYTTAYIYEITDFIKAFSQSSGPISQEEYEEINTIAEDILGGVE